MNSLQADTEYALKVLDGLTVPPSTLPDTQINEDKSRNAAGCITAFLCARLANKGTQPEGIKWTTFQWSHGLVNVRNAVNDHFWTNLRHTVVEHFQQLSANKPSAYLMVNWQPNNENCHVWAIPRKSLTMRCRASPLERRRTPERSKSSPIRTSFTDANRRQTYHLSTAPSLGPKRNGQS